MYFEIHPRSSDPVSKWEKVGNEWKISSGTRTKEDMDVTIVPDVAASCAKDSVVTKKLFVEYDDGFTVEIHATGKHLKIKPDDVNKVTGSSDHVLDYGTAGTGFIKNVYADNKSGTPACTFSTEKRLRWIEIDDK